MIERIIEWSLKNRFLVACGTLLLVALGVRSVYLTLVDDAFPQAPKQTLGLSSLSIFAKWQNKSS
jgi:copper/silver efflux system protein